MIILVPLSEDQIVGSRIEDNNPRNMENVFGIMRITEIQGLHVDVFVSVNC